MAYSAGQTGAIDGTAAYRQLIGKKKIFGRSNYGKQ